MDTSIDASFQTILPSVYALTLASAGIMAHARSVLVGYEDRVITKPSVTAFLFSISTRVGQPRPKLGLLLNSNHRALML